MGVKHSQRSADTTSGEAGGVGPSSSREDASADTPVMTDGIDPADDTVVPDDIYPVVPDDESFSPRRWISGRW